MVGENFEKVVKKRRSSFAAFVQVRNSPSPNAGTLPVLGVHKALSFPESPFRAICGGGADTTY
jgi:hypothetical protein